MEGSNLTFDILIADAGATKIEWVALGASGTELMRCTTPGVNAVVSSADAMREIFGDASFELPYASIGAQIFYYGAGCAGEEACSRVADALLEVWPVAKCFVASDLLGAARALLGRSKGIACILGTGSNACLCENGNIVSRINSLGYILGDEGSGAAIGKRFIADYFKGYIPADIKDDFDRTFNLSLPQVLDHVYRQPAPNRYLASFAPFLRRNLNSPYVKALVMKEFTEFFRTCISGFDGARHLPICFTGSIAHHFSAPLREAADALGYEISRIYTSPLEGMIRYHSKYSQDTPDAFTSL